MTKKKSKIRIGNVKRDVIISQDQSGGTTAHETRTATDKKSSKSKWSIITVIATVASIVAILTYFGVKPVKENKVPKDEEEKISIGDVNGDVVISQNQSGGITAHNVNIGPQDRKLSADYTSQIDNFISKNPNKKIVITAVMGDQEAIRFASQIKNYLESIGYKPEGVNQAIYKEQMSPQNIKITDDRIDIIIGGKQ